MSGWQARRVGHKGADMIAPGNTFESFDAALAAGVDMIEFDVLPERLDGTGRLLLAHDYHDAAARSPATLDEGLDYLASDRFDGVELLVDLKLPGYELRVAQALDARGVAGRCLISTQYIESLDLIRASGSRARLGWTVPKLRRDPFRNRAMLPFVYVALAVVRATLPCARRARDPRRALRCAHGALEARDAPRSSAPCAAPEASCTCGPSTSCRGCARSKRSASAGSSPTTRGCSRRPLLLDRAVVRAVARRIAELGVLVPSAGEHAAWSRSPCRAASIGTSPFRPGPPAA